MRARARVTGWGASLFQTLADKTARDITEAEDAGCYTRTAIRTWTFSWLISSPGREGRPGEYGASLLSLAKILPVIRHYEHNGNSITIAPGAYGMPTIWDKDVLIYCCSQLVEGMRQGREPQQVIRLTAYDFLVSTNRDTSKHGYDLLCGALERLAGVRITTNIVTGDVRVREGFGLLDWWRIIEKSPTTAGW